MAQINGVIPMWELESTHYFMSQAISQRYKVSLVGDVSDETTPYRPILLMDTPQATRGTIPSANGKNASDAKTEPEAESPAALIER